MNRMPTSAIGRLLPPGLILGLLCAANPCVQAQDHPSGSPTAADAAVAQPMPVPEEVLPLQAAPVAEAGIASYPPYAATPDPFAPRGPVCSACARPSGGRDACRCRESAISRWWNGSAKPCLQESHWGYCNYFDPPPFGASLRQATAAQVAEGLRAQMVLYQYDFYASNTLQAVELNERGREQLARMAQVHAATQLPIVVELIPGNHQLSLHRRAHVTQLLQQHGLPQPEHCVLLQPVRSGLYADEALLFYGNMLQQIGQAGTSMGSPPPPSSEP